VLKITLLFKSLVSHLLPMTSVYTYLIYFQRLQFTQRRTPFL